MEYLPYVAAGLATFIVCFLFWPGYMSHDSLTQLSQARFGIHTTAHPPIMSLLWRALDGILPGPGLMLAFQVGVFFFSAAHILRLSVPNPYLVSLLVLAVVPVPPVLGLLSTVWKSVAMTSLFLAAFALLWSAREAHSRGLWFAGVTLAFIAVCFRHNSAAGMLPLAVFAAAIWWRFDRPSLRQMVSRTALLAFAIVVLSVAVSGLLGEMMLSLEAPQATNVVYPPRTSFMPLLCRYDLIGMSYYSGEIAIPEGSYAHLPSFDRDDIVHLYRPETLHLSRSDAEGRPLRPAECEAERWLRTIRRHPGAYLKHRLNVLGQYLGVTREAVWYPFHGNIDENTLGVSTGLTPRSVAVKAYLVHQFTWPTYRVYVYYLLALFAVVWIAVKRKKTAYPLVVLWSMGTCYWVLSFPAQFAIDLRYHSLGIGTAVLVSLAALGLAISELGDRRAA